MKKNMVKYLLFIFCLGIFTEVNAQTKRKAVKRTATKRANTASTKKTKTKTKAKVKGSTAEADSLAAAKAIEAPANDTLPIPKVRKSLRPDEAVETTALKDRTPLPYEHLRAEDALYRQRIWREIDAREKINMPFRYATDEDNGNQRFISILLQAIQDSAVTVFNNIDDRFTTPMTKSEVAAIVAGDLVPVHKYGPNGEDLGTDYKRNEISLDSFYKFRLKEEVIFDKESSRLFWRILGIAPLKHVITASGVDLGEVELFWVYYPDMRPTLSKYEVYNGKNYGARMSWEDLFESRMFYGRIIKTSMDNPYDLAIKNYPGLKESNFLQLLEGENIKETIFNYEQDLWSY